MWLRNCDICYEYFLFHYRKLKKQEILVSFVSMSNSKIVGYVQWKFRMNSSDQAGRVDL